MPEEAVLDKKEEVKGKEQIKDKPVETTQTRLDRALNAGKAFFKSWKQQKEEKEDEGEDKEGADASKKDDKSELNEGKVEKRKAEIQKEIDALTAKKKTLSQEVGVIEADKQRIAELEQRLEKLEAPKKDADVKSVVQKNEKSRISQYLEDDKDKPREKRREMSKEDLEDWFSEDSVAATEWINARALRRADERKADEQKMKQKDGEESFNKQQARALAKLVAKYPDVAPELRTAELKAEGLNKKEIHETLMKENLHYRLCYEIAESDKKYVNEANGPELVMLEMEKRLLSMDDDGKQKKKEGKEKDKKKFYSEEELEQAKKDAAEMERKRLESIDEDSSSGGSNGKHKNNPMMNDPKFKKQVEIMRAAYKRHGIDKDPVQAVADRLAYRKSGNLDKWSKSDLKAGKDDD